GSRRGRGRSQFAFQAADLVFQLRGGGFQRIVFFLQARVTAERGVELGLQIGQGRGVHRGRRLGLLGRGELRGGVGQARFQRFHFARERFRAGFRIGARGLRAR